MGGNDDLAARFEEQRPRLTAVALRLLGVRADADDAVQEAWLRLRRLDPGSIDNLGGWLTTVVARLSLDMLRARAARREVPGGEQTLEAVAAGPEGDPEHDALVADSIGPALVLVLDALSPSERVAFVLHDLFSVPFQEIGPVLGRSPAAAKQLASRARGRLRASEPGPPPDLARQRAVVEAFLVASRAGDFDALLAVLDPDIVLLADEAGVAMGADGDVRGAAAVAGIFSGRALGAEPALVDGLAGVAWAPGGDPRVVWDFTIDGDRVVRIDMVAAAGSLEEMRLQLLGDG